MHVEMIGSGRDRAVLEHDPVGLDAFDVPEADDVLDRDGAARPPRGWPSRPSSSSARRPGRCGASPPRLRDARTPPPPTATRPSPRAARRHPRMCANAGLEERTVQDPVVARTDPGDVVGIGTAIEQPADRIQRGLSAADDDVPGRPGPRASVARRPGRSGRRRQRRTAPVRWRVHAMPCRSRRRRGFEPSHPSPDQSRASGSAGRPGSRTSGRTAHVRKPETGGA